MSDVNPDNFDEMYARGNLATQNDEYELFAMKIDYSIKLLKEAIEKREFEVAEASVQTIAANVDRLDRINRQIQRWQAKLDEITSGGR